MRGGNWTLSRWLRIASSVFGVSCATLLFLKVNETAPRSGFIIALFFVGLVAVMVAVGISRAPDRLPRNMIRHGDLLANALFLVGFLAMTPEVYFWTQAETTRRLHNFTWVLFAAILVLNGICLFQALKQGWMRFRRPRG